MRDEHRQVEFARQLGQQEGFSKDALDDDSKRGRTGQRPPDRKRTAALEAVSRGFVHPELADQVRAAIAKARGE